MVLVGPLVGVIQQPRDSPGAVTLSFYVVASGVCVCVNSGQSTSGNSPIAGCLVS